MTFGRNLWKISLNNYSNLEVKKKSVAVATTRIYASIGHVELVMWFSFNSLGPMLKFNSIFEY